VPLVDPIYLDNNASTVPEIEVVEAVSAAMGMLYANPSSTHALGRQAREAIEDARVKVASLLGCQARSVVFTSGATEANNLAICGVWQATRITGSSRTAIAIGATEHASVVEAASALGLIGAEIRVLPVDRDGLLDLDAAEAFIDERTVLVSTMGANSETGTLAPLAAVARIAKACGAYIHVDATQMPGRVPLDFDALDLDLLSISAHKMHGPRGVGALVVRRGVTIEPIVHGGGHERGLRSGTLNTAGIVGLGIAAQLARTGLAEAHRMRALRDTLQLGLEKSLSDVTLNGHPTHRLPNTVNLRFGGSDAEATMASLTRVACSAGSACHAGAIEPSPVLTAMGLDSRAAHESLRFSLSRHTTESDIESAIADIRAAVAYVRQAAAVGVP
jgi:cysteine desulfurase